MTRFSDQWRQDVRMAARSLGRVPGFTLLAVATLAIGIGGTTAMFAVVEAVLLRPLPVFDQDRLAVMWKEVPSSGFAHVPLTLEEIDAIRAASNTLESAAGVDYNGAWQWTSLENGNASGLSGSAVTGDFFGVLGVEPALGRALTYSDDRAGAERVLVIGHELWQRRYGGSRTIIGRPLQVRNETFRIVGVMPPDFEYPAGAEAWMTIAALRSTLGGGQFTPMLDMVARLRPGVTVAQASAELGEIVRRVDASQASAVLPAQRVVVATYPNLVVGDVRPAILLLFGAVGLVLLIASANVANLLLIRGASRRPELALRTALGAGRGRLARQLAAESIVLALLAGITGVAFTWWALRAVAALVPQGLPRVDDARIDAWAIGFAVVVSGVAAVLAGLAPALSATRGDLIRHLRGAGRDAHGMARRHGRRALVIAQVALAVMVVAAAGLLLRSLLRLERVDTGIAADQLVFARLALPRADSFEATIHFRFMDDLVERLESTPGIRSVTPASVPPFSGTGGWDVPAFVAEGQSASRAAANPALNLETAHPNYFATFDIAIVRGRAFDATDREGSVPVVILSRDVAERTWPDRDPLGQRIRFGAPEADGPWRTIVGIAAPVRYRELARVQPTAYVPAAQFGRGSSLIVLRTSQDAASAGGLVREALRALEPDARVMQVSTFSQLLREPLARPRFNAALIGIFGIAALLLAAVGLYGVMSAYVRQRTTEIGIRLSLGATPRDVRRLVLGEGLRLAAIGAALGLAGAFATTRLVRRLLYNIHPLDPAAILAAAGALLAVAAIAVYLPARRATRVDVMATLRAD